MYFRKSFSQEEKMMQDVDGSESEPLAIINADLQEQSKCDTVIACLQPSGIQGNEESISEIEPFHSTSSIHGVEVSKQKKATKNDSCTNSKSSNSRRLLKHNENTRLHRNTQPKSKSVSPNSIVTSETIKMDVKRKNVNKALNKNRCTDTILTSSATMNEEFPGTEQICPSEIAVESCPESQGKVNEESNSYSSENNLSASTRLIRGIEVSKQKDAAKISTSDTDPKSSMKRPLSYLNGNKHIESKTLGKKSRRKKTDKSKGVKTSIETCYTEPILTTLDENEDFDGTRRDAVMAVEPLRNNCLQCEIVKDVIPTNKGELVVGTKISKPNWITEIDNDSDSESLSRPLLQLSVEFKHITQRKIQCISPKANEESEIFPAIRKDKRKDSKAFYSINKSSLINSRSNEVNSFPQVSSNYLPTKKRFKLV